MATKETFRMTLDLTVDDHTRLKTMAALHGKPMRNIIVEALEEFYRKQSIKQKTKTNKPNTETRKAINEVKRGKGLVECSSVEDFFNKFGI